MEALKPFVGMFSNGSVVSFALVQRTDPESVLCVTEFLCRCVVTKPGTTSLLDGGPDAEMDNCKYEKKLNVLCTVLRLKGGNDGDMTNPYRTISTLFKYGYQ